MAEFKLVIGDPKSKKCFQREVKDDLATSFLGKKIGEKIRGESIDLTGYEFEITGGSDYCGFPMRKDVPGQGRKRILSTASTGIKALKKKRRKNKVFQKFNDSRQRRIVCGNTIHEKIHQINLKVLKAGKASLDVAEATEGDAPAEAEAKPEVKAEEKKEAPKEEPKKEEVKEEPKVEEKKEEEQPKEEPKLSEGKQELSDKKVRSPETSVADKASVEEKKEEPKKEEAPAKEEEKPEEKKEEPKTEEVKEDKKE